MQTAGVTRRSTASVRNLPEGLYRSSFVFLHVKDGVELRDLKQIVNLLGEVQQFQFPALVLYRGVGAHEFADPGTVDIVDVSEVQHKFLLALGEQIFHVVAQHNAALAQGDTAAAIHNSDAVNLACAGLQIHWEASLPSAAVAWTCLISLISVPVCDG